MPDRSPGPPAQPAPRGSSSGRPVGLTPQAALCGQDRPLPALAPCVHYAGSERFIAKALALQGEGRLAFDVAADCEDVRRARVEFGFLRMWSIHPAQIEPIVRAMQRSATEIAEAATVLAAARAADWAPLAAAGKLHDRGSYRYFWNVLQRAHAAGTALPASAADYFHAADA